MLIYHDLSGGHGIYEEALQYISQKKELKEKVFQKLVERAEKIDYYRDGSVYSLEIDEKKFEEIEEIREILNILRKFEKRSRDIDEELRVVAKVFRIRSYYIIYNKYYNEYYLVSNIVDFIKDEKVRKKVMNTQRIKKIISNTIFLSNNKTIKFWFIKYGKKIIKKLRQKTRNKLLETSVRLGEGADVADNHIFHDIEEIIYYKEFSEILNKEGIKGLGFDGEALAVMVARKESGKKVVIIEEVISYNEGYCVTRKVIDKEIIDIILSEKFRKEVLPFFK